MEVQFPILLKYEDTTTQGPFDKEPHTVSGTVVSATLLVNVTEETVARLKQLFFPEKP